MSIRTAIRSVLTGIVLYTPILSAQPGTTAVPGLTIPTSPWGNGMGGATASLPSLDAASTIANPGQLGLFSLDNLFSASTYTPKTNWAPAIFGGFSEEPTITTSALNAGLNLKDLLSLPFGASVGFGYSRTYWDLGTITVTNSSSPQPVGVASLNDTYVNYTLGIGLEYVVSLGIGMNFKRITSTMPGVGADGVLREMSATPGATDFGVLLDIPVVEIVSRVLAERLTVTKGIEPFVNLSAAYVKSNVGGNVTYADYLQPDPLPRTAVVGLGAAGGLSAKAGNADWRIVSFALVRQAEDLLVNRYNDGTFNYKGGLGDLSIGENILVGRTTGFVLIRKGWEIGAAEFLYLRGGSTVGDGYDYSTSGYSICLGGLVRALEFASPEIAGTSWVAFIGDHVDVQYHSATYGPTDSSLNGTTFKELNLVLRGFRW